MQPSHNNLGCLWRVPGHYIAGRQSNANEVAVWSQQPRSMDELQSVLQTIRLQLSLSLKFPSSHSIHLFFWFRPFFWRSCAQSNTVLLGPAHTNNQNQVILPSFWLRKCHPLFYYFQTIVAFFTLTLVNATPRGCSSFKTAAARLLTHTVARELTTVHWLPGSLRIEFKILLLISEALQQTHSGLLSSYESDRCLRFSS